MEYLVTSEEMRMFDASTIDELKVPGIVLMERAAAGACDVILDRFGEDIRNRHISVLCGYGNNGGDGLAVARMLYQKHADVSVLLIGNPDKASELNLKEQEIAGRYGIDITRVNVAEAVGILRESYAETDIIVDALFGTGLSRPLDTEWDGLTDAINSSGSFICAMDIPSGLNADGRGGEWPCVSANLTATFGFVKLGMVTYPGASFCGEIVRVDMGIDEFSILGDEPVHRRFTGLRDIYRPERIPYANKGTYGKLLVISGSADIYGAAYMAAKAAFQTGIGMVRIVTHVANKTALQLALPEAMYTFYDDDTSDDELRDELSKLYEWADGILIGPGIGTGHSGEVLVDSVLRDTGLPAVIDADAVRLIADNDDRTSCLRSADDRTVILTPHVGEFACLTHRTISDVRVNMTDMTKETADDLKAVIICKDARSIIASAGHREIYVNSSGNEGMATAGSGDVLAGICAVFMIRSDDGLVACASAAYIHGLAGDDAAKRLGSTGMTASDIIDSIQTVIGEMNETRRM